MSPLDGCIDKMPFSLMKWTGPSVKNVKPVQWQVAEFLPFALRFRHVIATFREQCDPFLYYQKCYNGLQIQYKKQIQVRPFSVAFETKKSLLQQNLNNFKNTYHLLLFNFINC